MTRDPARVARFRQGVYGGRDLISAGCQVLLLRLADGMDHKCIVSIPRSQLADEFAVPPPRISEWIGQARNAGYLDQVRRGRPGLTAVYQGLYVVPAKVRPRVPVSEDLSLAKGYGSPDQVGVRPGVPSGTGLEVRPRHTQVGSGSGELGDHLHSTPRNHAEGACIPPAAHTLTP